MPSIIRPPASSSVNEIEITGMTKENAFDFSVPLVGMFSSYVVVGVRSYLSKICHQDDEGLSALNRYAIMIGGSVPSGKIFSVLASLESIDALLGSILFNILYSHTLANSPSLIFILACALHLFTLPIFRSVNSIRRRRKSSFDSYILFNDRHANEEIEATPLDSNNNASRRVSFRYLTREDDRHYHRWSMSRYNRLDRSQKWSSIYSINWSMIRPFFFRVLCVRGRVQSENKANMTGGSIRIFLLSDNHGFYAVSVFSGRSDVDYRQYQYSVDQMGWSVSVEREFRVYLRDDSFQTKISILWWIWWERDLRTSLPPSKFFSLSALNISSAFV